MAHPRFKEIVESLVVLHVKKSADYGSEDNPLGNINAATRLGVTPFTGVALRLQDKFARLESYVKKGKLHNEGVEDTLRDIAVYAIIGLITLEEGKLTPPERIIRKPQIPKKPTKEKAHDQNEGETGITYHCAGCSQPLKTIDARKRTTVTGETKYYCNPCYELYIKGANKNNP